MKQFMLISLLSVCLLATSCKTIDIIVNPTHKILLHDINRLSKNSILVKFKNGSKMVVTKFNETYLEEASLLLQDSKYIMKNNIKFLEIRMTNTGGSIFIMTMIIDIIKDLKDHGVHITTVCESVVASAAVSIFELGDVRIMSPNGWIMMHPAQGINRNYINESTLKMLENIEDLYASIISLRSKLSKEEVLSFLRSPNSNDMYWFNAKECLELGLIDKIDLILEY